MNILPRAKLSSHLIFSSASSASFRGRCLLNLHPQTTALLQCEFYSTKTSTQGSSQKTQQSTKPKIQKPSAKPSTTFSQRVRKQTEALTGVWPKPGEIPYQAKVANFVNLIGRVGLPIRFESSADGKHLATTAISVTNGGVKNALPIPVLFEGFLAHVVSCHVRQDDCVFVSGHLSVDAIGLVPSESLGNFHVVAENINFVEGLKKDSLSGLETDMLGRNEAEVFDELTEGAVAEIEVEEDEPPTQKAISENGNVVVSSLEKNNGKKQDADKITNLWRDLVKSPLQWWDFREHKANGLVKGKHPDFKQKVTSEPLWISTAPKWILPGINKLEFDVIDMKPKQALSGDSWKDLVENPDKWWDCRAKKKSPKAPDFKHKETGKVLWLDTSPNWVSSKIPPVRD